jgi:phosphotransferase system HPr-like phosphotransfer protein
MPSVPISGSATLTNSVRLHARPAVKLTTLAKQFVASVELSNAVGGPRFDVKSPVMRLKAPNGTTLFLGRPVGTQLMRSRRSSPLLTTALVRKISQAKPPRMNPVMAERRIKGRVAAPGLFRGRAVKLSSPQMTRIASGDAAAEAASFKGALEAARREFKALASSTSGERK